MATVEERVGLGGRKQFHYKVMLMNEGNGEQQEVDCFCYWGPSSAYVRSGHRVEDLVSLSCAAEYKASSAPLGAEKAPIVGLSAVLQ